MRHPVSFTASSVCWRHDISYADRVGDGSRSLDSEWNTGETSDTFNVGRRITANAVLVNPLQRSHCKSGDRGKPACRRSNVVDTIASSSSLQQQRMYMSPWMTICRLRIRSQTAASIVLSPDIWHSTPNAQDAMSKPVGPRFASRTDQLAGGSPVPKKTARASTLYDACKVMLFKHSSITG